MVAVVQTVADQNIRGVLEANMANILVVDDQKDVRNILKEFLTIDTHKVDLADNGKAALKLADVNGYDLVITDIVMPEKDGLEVITGVKRLFPHVKIIAISGGAVRLNKENLLIMAKALGADRVLAKPLDFFMLQVAVNELLTMEK